MRCSRAVKGEGKKRKFGECVRARERGESFTRSVHPRSEKAGTFFDLVGRYTRESGSLFSFSLVVFRASIERCSRGGGSLGGIGVRDGNGFALWSMGCGCSEYSVARRKHSAQRRCEALRAVSLQFVRFYAFSRLRRESPRVFF